MNPQQKQDGRLKCHSCGAELRAPHDDGKPYWCTECSKEEEERYLKPPNTQLISILMRLGFTRIQSRALDYLLSETLWPALTRDIEKGADLRQQEVNMVIRDFVKRGWLEEIKAPRNGTKGKPPFQYRFTLNKGSLYEIIQADARKKITELEGLVCTDLYQILR